MDFKYPGRGIKLEVNIILTEEKRITSLEEAEEMLSHMLSKHAA
ncbi:MAG: hypothetical protein WDN67_00290 [Candidatus Moraniibacteriota bacterium]